MKTRTILYADDNKVLTNGTVYGTQIFLADGESAENYHEITKEEYEEILKGEDLEQSSKI